MSQIQIFFTLIVVSWSTDAANSVFKIPRLILHADQYYLIKNKELDLSCQIEPGWRGVTISDVKWFRDEMPIEESSQKIRSELIADGPTLRIRNRRYQTEGNYHCSAIVKSVQIANGKRIDASLVSAPVKFRRSRMTKFDEVDIEIIRVQQDQPARIPCLGMPDVIPGPPKIHFDKDGNDENFVDRRFIVTSSGMQIVSTAVSDTGNYYCVVTNQFTNMTKKSKNPVKLVVFLSTYAAIDSMLIYPLEPSSIQDPIVMHVVKGKNVILECLMTNVRIMWIKVRPSSSGLASNNDRLRFRRLYGNLMINSLSEADSGVYACEGYPINANSLSEIPKVFYKLEVHAPTDVKLSLEPSKNGKTLQVNCLALNLYYEIPIVYIKGVPLINATKHFGIVPRANFFTNPTNAALTSDQRFSGTIQCISRPAMDEAEIYGIGLERGRAINLFVDGSVANQMSLISQGPDNATKFIGESVYLVCIVVPSSKRTLWIKDGKRVALIGNKRIRLVGKATLKIVDIQLEDEGWYACEASDNVNQIERSTAYLTVLEKEPSLAQVPRLSQEKPSGPPDRAASSGSLADSTIPHPIIDLNVHQTAADENEIAWSFNDANADYRRIDRVELETQTYDDNANWDTVKALGNETRKLSLKDQYVRQRFRLKIQLENGSTISSKPSKWIENSYQAKIFSLRAHERHSLILIWNPPPADYDPEMKIFINYAENNSTSEISEIEVNQTANEVMLENLEPSTEYKAWISTLDTKRKRQTSKLAFARTKGSSIFVTVYNRNRWTLNDKILSIFERNIYIVIILTALLVLLIFLLLCTWSRCRYRIRSKPEVSGKFTDTSQRIFSENRVQKSRSLFLKNSAQTIPMNANNQMEPLLSRTILTSCNHSQSSPSTP